ncbi:MAG: ATP-dependent Clp protease proteolytic subunit [Pseudomonadota bacterium]
MSSHNGRGEKVLQRSLAGLVALSMGLSACAPATPTIRRIPASITPEIVDALVVPARGATPDMVCEGIDDLPLRQLASDLGQRSSMVVRPDDRKLLVGKMDAKSTSTRTDETDDVVTTAEAEDYVRWLAGAEKGEHLLLGVNSPGGNLSIAGALVDAMAAKRDEAKIATVVLGLAASGGALVAAAGSYGFRYAIEGSVFLTHTVQVSTERFAVLDPEDTGLQDLPEELRAQIRADPGMMLAYGDLPNGSELQRDLKLLDLYMRAHLYHFTPRELSDLCLAALMPEDGSDVVLSAYQALRLGFVDAVVVDTTRNGVLSRATSADDTMWVRDLDPRGGGRSLSAATGP